MSRSVHSFRLLALLVVLLLVVGCAAPPDRVALSTLQTMKVTADSAMRICEDLYAQGQFSEANKTQAIAAYDHFATIEKAAAVALQGIGTQAQADGIVQSVSQALAELLGILRSLGVKV